ncbi:MAG: DUF2442 domain-containing protein [Actinomycetota bacterium]|nr:DUF2442 domain-containing protein [Actinomycetota bacterium]
MKKFNNFPITSSQISVIILNIEMQSILTQIGPETTMPLMPEIETVKNNTDSTILVYFDNGIIKIFDLKPFLQNTQNSPHPEIKLSPEGALLNGSINISDYDLWATGKFYGWNK